MILTEELQVNLGKFWKILRRQKKYYHQHAKLGKLFFTFIAVIGGKLFINHPKNVTHVHMECKDLVSVIITLGGGLCGGNTVCYDGMKISDMGSRAFVLKHLHGRIILFNVKKNHKGTRRRGHGVVLSFILEKDIFIHIYCHWDRFLTNIWIKQTKKKVSWWWWYWDKPKYFFTKRNTIHILLWSDTKKLG